MRTLISSLADHSINYIGTYISLFRIVLSSNNANGVRIKDFIQLESFELFIYYICLFIWSDYVLSISNLPSLVLGAI